jgi:hypothetical protein
VDVGLASLHVILGHHRRLHFLRGCRLCLTLAHGLNVDLQCVYGCVVTLRMVRDDIETGLLVQLVFPSTRMGSFGFTRSIGPMRRPARLALGSLPGSWLRLRTQVAPPRNAPPSPDRGIWG